jgi:hypothetical protein
MLSYSSSLLSLHLYHLLFHVPAIPFSDAHFSAHHHVDAGQRPLRSWSLTSVNRHTLIFALTIRSSLPPVIILPPFTFLVCARQVYPDLSDVTPAFSHSGRAPRLPRAEFH